MYRLTTASATFITLLIIIPPRMSWSTSGWLAIDEKTVQGTWVALDQESEEVCRLQIRGADAILAMSAGPTQSEFVFRSNGLTVKKGRLLMRMAKEPGGASLDVIGDGRANTTNGAMTLTMRFVKQAYPPWRERTVAFVKECCDSIADALSRNDKRARALVEGTLKANSPGTTVPAAERHQMGGDQQTTPNAPGAPQM